MIPGTQHVEVFFVSLLLSVPLPPLLFQNPSASFLQTRYSQGALPRIIVCCISHNTFIDVIGVIGILHNRRTQNKFRVNFLTSGIGRVLRLIRCVTPHKCHLISDTSGSLEPNLESVLKVVYLGLFLSSPRKSTISIKKCPNEVQWRN